MKKTNVLEDSFDISVLLKGIDGIFEIVGGLTLYFIKPETITWVANILTRHELSQDPHDLIANYFLHVAQRLTLNAELFAAFYLISHGVVKIFLVYHLLKKRLWSYPVSIVFFSLFTIYQIYRFVLTGSIAMLLLTIFDILVIILVWLEYQRIKGKMRHAET